MFNLSETRSDPLYATVQVNGASLKMEIDTWASASIISEETCGKLWSNDRTPALCESPIKLRTYTGEIIPISGAVNVNIAYGNQTAEARLLVVKGTWPSLLGQDWLSKIKLNWGEIRLIKRLCAEDVVARYPDVFKDELGTLAWSPMLYPVSLNGLFHLQWSIKWKRNLRGFSTSGSLNQFSFLIGQPQLFPCWKMMVQSAFVETINWQSTRQQTWDVPYSKSGGLVLNAGGRKNFH